MARFMLTHRHAPDECPVAFAAWRGFDSPLRHGEAKASCSSSGGRDHVMWWTVDAPSEHEAIAQLPIWIAERTEISEIGEVSIP